MVRAAHPAPALNEMNENNFQVVITNQLKADQDKNLITKKLAALFKIDEQKAAQFLLKPQTLIKDNLDQATANKYLAAIQQTGASCKVIDKNELEDLPQIVEPPKTESITANPRDTSRTTIRTKQEPELSLIAREAKSEKETREKLATLQHASEETLCPECGTIRGAADALCLHCGYSPSATENTGMGINKKKVAMFAVILVIVAAVALVFWVPFIQKMLAKNKLDADFKLAFDTRNHISAFIDQTGFFPNQNMDANLPADISNDSIESIIVSDNSVITITLRASAINEPTSQTLIFVPRHVKGIIAWNCREGTLRNELRPEFCQK